VSRESSDPNEAEGLVSPGKEVINDVDPEDRSWRTKRTVHTRTYSSHPQGYSCRWDDQSEATEEVVGVRGGDKSDHLSPFRFESRPSIHVNAVGFV